MGGSLDPQQRLPGKVTARPFISEVINHLKILRKSMTFYDKHGILYQATAKLCLPISLDTLLTKSEETDFQFIQLF